jgi:hypothetical protein
MGAPVSEKNLKTFDQPGHSPMRTQQSIERRMLLLIIKPLPIENSRRIFSDPWLSRFGLFGRRKIKEICSLASRRQLIG